MMPDLPMRLARKWCHYHDGLSDDPESCMCGVFSEIVREALEEAEKIIPTNWTDPLLSGEQAALRGTGPWSCPDIERLLRGIAAALAALREE